MRQAREQKAQDLRKKNSQLFLARMKQLASLPELQNHKFVIPASLCPVGEKLMTVDEIDRYIRLNNLVFKPQEQHIAAQEEDLVSNCEVEVQAELTRIDKKVRNIFFKVPDNYMKQQQEDELE